MLRGSHRTVEAAALQPGDIIAFAHRVVLEVRRENERIVVLTARPGGTVAEWTHHWCATTPIILLDPS